MNKSLWEKNYAEVRQALQEMEKEYQNWQKVFRKYFILGLLWKASQYQVLSGLSMKLACERWKELTKNTKKLATILIRLG